MTGCSLCRFGEAAYLSELDDEEEADMTLQQLKYVVTVADTGKINDVAAREHLFKQTD